MSRQTARDIDLGNDWSHHFCFCQGQVQLCRLDLAGLNLPSLVLDATVQHDHEVASVGVTWREHIYVLQAYPHMSVVAVVVNTLWDPAGAAVDSQIRLQGENVVSIGFGADFQASGVAQF